MGTLSITTSVPEGSNVFVFGSILHGLKDAEDVDVIVIYDPQVCPPGEVWHRHAVLGEQLSVFFRVPVHMTMLSCIEEHTEQFAERVAAIPLAKAIALIDGPSR